MQGNNIDISNSHKQSNMSLPNANEEGQQSHLSSYSTHQTELNTTETTLTSNKSNLTIGMDVGSSSTHTRWSVPSSLKMVTAVVGVSLAVVCAVAYQRSNIQTSESSIVSSNNNARVLDADDTITFDGNTKYAVGPNGEYISEADLLNWWRFYDTFQGSSWYRCAHSRSNPCGRDVIDPQASRKQVICSLIGNEMRITSIILPNNNMIELFDPEILSGFAALSGIVDFSSDLAHP